MARTRGTTSPKQRERVLTRRLRDLRKDWWAWKNGKGLYERIGGHGGHPALYFCEHTIPDPGCEACCAEQYRRDRRAEIANEAAPLKAELDQLT